MNRLAAFSTTIGVEIDKRIQDSGRSSLDLFVLHKRRSKFVLFSQLKAPAPVSLATEDSIEPDAPRTFVSSVEPAILELQDLNAIGVLASRDEPQTMLLVVAKV